jgi:1,4-alpha-glucan branching enzyme
VAIEAQLPATVRQSSPRSILLRLLSMPSEVHLPFCRQARRCSRWAKKSERAKNLRTTASWRTVRAFSANALATTNIEIMNVHNAERVLVFHRWRGPEHYLNVTTFSDSGYPQGWEIDVPVDARGRWRLIFTSDAAIYGGDGVSNDGELEAFLVLCRVPGN